MKVELQLKEKKVDELVGKLVSATQACDKKFGAIAQRDLKHNSADLQAACANIKNKYGEFIGRAAAVDENGFEVLCADVSVQDQDYTDVEKKIKSQMETIDYLRSQKGTTHRSSYQTRRWRVQKLQQGSFRASSLLSLQLWWRRRWIGSTAR